MPDTLLRMGDSLVQHGPHSNRIYALRLSPGDVPGVLDEFWALAEERGYGKIIAKARREHLDAFEDRGYRSEALIPDFHGPGEDLLFMGKFLDPDRALDSRAERIQEVLKVASTAESTSASGGSSSERGAPGPQDEAGAAAVILREADGSERVTFREADGSDLGAVSQIYQEVFESYPFPIQDPAHLQGEMESGTRFFTAWEAEALVAASSMESGGVPGTVEMTDFATLPSQRGRGLATQLLAMMDREAEKARVRVAFTIARAISFGMNITFARRGYTFGGTLVNNTQISGTIESMNVWYKLLRVH